MKYLGFAFALVVFTLLGYGFWFLSENLPKKADRITDSSYRLAIQKSREDKKPVVLIFTAVWCGPCQYMKREVYHSSQVEAVSDRFHWLTVDVDDPTNSELVKAYGVSGIPHIEIVDETGKSLDKIVGSRPPEAFVEFLKGTFK